MLLKDVGRALSVVGTLGTLKLLLSRRWIKSLLPRWTSVLWLRGYKYPFHFRHGTTDKYVVAEVLLNHQYQCLSDSKDIQFIVDAGANIGTASVFLLNAFPDARILALEPDEGNFEMLKRNLSYYGPRATAIKTALWNRKEQLSIERGTFRDGGEWSTQVRRSEGKDEILATTVPELMMRYNVNTIDLLKIDIEGAERVVFENIADVEPWIYNVRTIAIELHDRDCRRVFTQSTSSAGSIVAQYGEVTVWQMNTAGGRSVEKGTW